MAKQEVTFVIRARDLTRTAFRRLGRSIRDVGRAMNSLIGLVGAGALIIGFQRAVEEVRNLDNAAQAAGVSVKKMAAIQDATRGLGLDDDDMSDALNELKVKLDEIREGDPKLIKDFQALGLTLDQIGSSTSLQAFSQILDSVDPANAAQFAGELDRIFGGDVARKLLPTLMQTTNQWLKSIADAMESERAKNAQANIEAARELEKQGNALKAETDAFLLQALPAITELVAALNNAIQFWRDTGFAEGITPTVDAALGTDSDAMMKRFIAAGGTFEGQAGQINMQELTQIQREMLNEIKRRNNGLNAR